MTERPAKMRNHEVQRAYLEQWLSPSAPRALWYIDLRPLQKQQEVSVQRETPESKSNGGYRCNANFAIHDYLYVPEGPEGRDDSLEEDFAELESDMVNLCRAAINGNVHSTKPAVIKRALMGCLSHCFRDAYGWQHITQESSSITHDELVSKAKSSLGLYEKRASGLAWSILWNLPVSLLTSDRPAWDLATRRDTEHTEIFMPLGPNVMLMGRKPSGSHKAGELYFCQGRAEHAKFCNQYNTITVNRARGWIVATSEQQLHALLPEFTTEKYERRISTDKQVQFNPATGEKLP